MARYPFLGERRSGASHGLQDKHRERDALQWELEDARTYDQWAQAAIEYDRRTGRERWKQHPRSSLYDHALIAEKFGRLRALREAGDARGLLYEIEEGLHGNLGGMGRAVLYQRARFGTKQLIQDYVHAAVDALLFLERVTDDVLSRATRHDLFDRASHCYGRTALMMSSGGTLMYFHMGVAKALFEQGVLPRVISGSSAGALVAAMLGCRTDDELEGFFTPQNLYFGEKWEPSRLERMTGIRRIFGTDAFAQTFDRLVPDLTFREAFERTGRHISISVSPRERHQSPRLLNALTSPHVLIRSAVRASCAIPGLFDPVQLLARDAQGRTVPFLKSKWIDGVFAADLPAKQLARLYGTNHYVVSYVNPALLLLFRDHRVQGQGFKPVMTMAKSIARNVLKSTDGLIGRYLPESSVGVINKIAQDVLSQEYVGDINIAPQRRLFPPHRLLSPWTHREIAEMMLEGERRTWPRIEAIRTSTAISRTLDGILDRASRRWQHGARTRPSAAARKGSPA